MKTAKKVLSVILALLIASVSCILVFAASSEDIASQATYTPTVMENGQTTLYISIPVQGNSDLSKLDTLVEVSKILFEQEKEKSENGWVNMSLQHIVGELFLHVAVYNMLKNVAKSESNPLHSYLVDASIADLNYDEKRVSDSTLSAVGGLILGIYQISKAL